MLRGARVGTRIGPNTLLMPNQGVNLRRDAVADDSWLTPLPQCFQLLLGQLLAVVIVAVALRQLARRA
ncbi:hypothetical protein D3C71_1815300 [compost metagenome]